MEVEPNILLAIHVICLRDAFFLNYCIFYLLTEKLCVLLLIVSSLVLSEVSATEEMQPVVNISKRASLNTNTGDLLPFVMTFLLWEEKSKIVGYVSKEFSA